MAFHVWSGESHLAALAAGRKPIAVGDPIMVLATKAKTPAKANKKTGDMYQLYIVRRDMKPSAAIKSGDDAAVCGMCPHRGTTCYTLGTTMWGADGMWQTHTDNGSPEFTLEMAASGAIRLGAYGDPCAVPYEILAPIVLASHAAGYGWTGYTHGWRTCDQRYRQLLMASCDSIEDMRDATAMGWRCYTVLPVGTTKVAGAVPCPSPRISCEQCLKCSGTGMGRRGNVSIEAHGARARRFTPVVGRPLPLSVTA